jgi:AcrR family transcriptional regulator
MPSAQTGRAARRRRREREIVDATRRLFDERGMQDAPIDEIAKAVGINKAVIYRHFESKEELFVLTVTRYLDELAAAFPDADAGHPIERLRDVTDRFARFCLAYPAFLDCAMSLMRRPAGELRLRVSGAVWFQLGQGMAACLDPLSRLLAVGTQQGAFDVDDPDFVANQLWTSALGTMHLARIGVGVRLAAPGAPAVFAVDPQRVRQACIDAAVALVAA